MSFLDVVATQLNDALGGELRAATLHKVSAGAAGAVDEAPAEVETNYSCRGFKESYELSEIDGTEVLRKDVKIVLLGKSIAGGTVTPSKDDYVTIDGTKYRLVAVDSDPAKATWTCQGRR